MAKRMARAPWEDDIYLTPRERIKVLFGIIVGFIGITAVLLALSVVPTP